MHLLIGFVCLILFFRIGEGGSCYEDRCSRNSVLKPGSFIKSTNNLFTFILQENGKLEILCGMSSIWIASCSDDNVKEFSFQEDGNLIVYRNDNSVAWNAGLTGRAPKGSKLIMQNDGNLVMYDDNDVYVWSIVTFNKCPAVDGKYGNWSEWTTCTKSCGGGLQRRMRICNNPPPFGTGKNCEGPSFQIQSCSNNFCEGPAGVSGAQVVVKKIIDNFHKIEFPDKKPSGKFLKAIFAIQEAVSQEFISVDPTVTEKTLDERLKDLEGFLIVAVDGGSIDFARTILGKGLFTFTKQKMKEGLPIVDIHTTEKRQFHRVVREIGDKKMETLLSAAQKYLDKLRKEIGDKKMDKILSAQGYSTLIFAIDTTGSMSAEINAAKAIAKQIINVTRESEVDYILSPFNDPGTGPVTYRNGSERSLFVSDIDGLRAFGGGDCPELAFTGMLNALEEGPEYGSPMFVFTDASAKDANSLNKAALKASADLSDITITFFTNLNGCSATDGIKDYEEIARHTEGNIFPLQDESELVKFTEFVNVSLRQDTVVASGGTITKTVKRSASSSHGFAVDDGISTVIVSVVVSSRNMASQVSLFDPDNIKVNPQATTSMSIIFQIMNPKPGRYQLTFPNTVGEYEYNVRGVSEKAIEFTTSFIYQQSVLKNSPPISITSPFKGIENTMVVRIGGVNRINVSSIRVDFVDTQGKVLQANILTDKLDSDDVRNATIVPPAGGFKVKLSGKTTSGFNFERISRGVIRAITGYLRPIFAGYDFTAKIGGGPVTVQMQYINKGSRESIKFQAKAKFGAISNPNQTKVVRSTTFILFRYTPPNSSSKKGKTDRITVTSTKSTGETFSQQVPILLIT